MQRQQAASFASRSAVEISTEQVEAIAPDQKSLAAASKLLKMNKWPQLAQSPEGLIWGSCQGSGANPYRVVAQTKDLWYKCTCPSRKFPCKHALALFWLFAENSERFARGEAPPEWATEALGRRRKSKAPVQSEKKKNDQSKSIAKASATAPSEPPKKKKAASKSKQALSRMTAIQASQELESWVRDHLRGGLSHLLKDPSPHCRRIAARLVDHKASVLASRVDELPASLLCLPKEDRLDALLAELSKWLLLGHAFRNEPERIDLQRELIRSESREELLNNTQAPRIRSQWEVIGTQHKTRRDGLIQQGSWLLNLQDSGQARYALLLDFFPASSGGRGSSFVSGERFCAELCFYPGPFLQRAVIVDRTACHEALDWPERCPLEHEDPLHNWSATLMQCPWIEQAPVRLGEGRVINHESRGWWLANEGRWTLPLSEAGSSGQEALEYRDAWGIWNGHTLDLLRLVQVEEPSQ